WCSACVSLSLSSLRCFHCHFLEAGVCCFELFKSRVPAKSVLSVQETDERCLLRAVILHTVKKQICAHPSLPWVQTIMKKVKTTA
uniref:Chemokine interleukin-8-like domain-containing protein n=1 Tax=Scleropages formosus TaxID=113540 RepID=A0A8C9S026_SCLFO